MQSMSATRAGIYIHAFITMSWRHRNVVLNLFRLFLRLSYFGNKLDPVIYGTFMPKSSREDRGEPVLFILFFRTFFSENSFFQCYPLL